MSVYNEEARISRAIDSLLSQTLNDFELIVIDDGSQDGTQKILESYRSRDSRIRIIRQENAGLTSALIRGCTEARGEYIARHDADDWSEPTRLAEQVTLLESDQNVGFVSCATQYVGPNDEPLELVIRRDDPAEATRKLLEERQGPPAHGSVMFRRNLYEAVGGYRMEFYCGQDADLWMRFAERSLIAHGTQRQYFARRDPLSLSGRMGMIQQQFGRLGQECRAARREGRSEQPFLDTARSLAEALRTRKRSGQSARGQATMAYLIGTVLARNGDPRAKDYFWQVVQANPLNWKGWCRIVLTSIRHLSTADGTGGKQ
jgi:hypothetical protein